MNRQNIIFLFGTAWCCAGDLAGPGHMPDSAVSVSIVELEPISTLSTRTLKDPREAPNTVNILTSFQLHSERMARTVPEALKETPGIMVQKTTHGQGSPFIRGFTGLHTLFLIDGIRLNNSVFREGPNQYWNTVDVLSLDRLEVVKGAGSVLFGSGAVGGTANARTLPALTEGYAPFWKGGSSYRFSSAEQSHSGRVELRGNLTGSLGLAAGISPKQFGDLQAGGPTGIQKNTGYTEFDGDIKFEYLPVPEHRFSLCYQNVSQDDIWRTHKTIYGTSWQNTDIGSDKLRVLDQKRNLSYLKYSGVPNIYLIREIDAYVSHQEQAEDRQRIQSDSRQDEQGFDVHTLGTGLQINSQTRSGFWSCGLDYYRDWVDSYSRRYTAAGILDRVELQGPVADDAAYDDFGVFFQNDVRLFGLLDIIPGIRFSYFQVDAAGVTIPLDGSRMRVYREWYNTVGSLRFVFHAFPKGRLNFYGGVSQGFRAPNLSDLTRLDNARSNEFEIPAPDLEPEKFLQGELGVRGTAMESENFILSGDIALYHTAIKGLIIRTPTGRVEMNGGELEYEITKKNSGSGYVRGLETGIQIQLFRQLLFSGSFSLLDGEVDTYPTSENILIREPMDRLMPQTAHVSLKWKSGGRPWWLRVALTFVDRQGNLSTRDRGDTQRIPPGGTPGYAVTGISGGYEIGRHVLLSAGIENLSDQDYRVHGSGVNEPGRNFVLNTEARF